MAASGVCSCVAAYAEVEAAGGVAYYLVVAAFVGDPTEGSSDWDG